MAAAVVMVPIWRRFLSTYPEVHLELAAGELPIDIVARDLMPASDRVIARPLT